MMARSTSRSSYAVLATLALFAAGAAYAATVEAQARKDYGRLRFAFEAPAGLQASMRGNVATLVFASPVTAAPETIATSLPGYVTGATLSADQKTLTLTLAKPYRIRQFMSGNTVGLDLLGPADATAKATTLAASTPPSPPEAMLTTKKPPASAPKPKPADKEKTKESAKEKPPQKPVATTKASPASAESSMLSTKKAAAEKTILSTKSAHPTPEEKHTAPTATPTPEKTPEAEAQPPTAATPSTDAGLGVTLTHTEDKSTLTFPWKQRTAATIFKRGNDIWIVFSRFADVNAKKLAATMPKHVVQVTQYADPEHTILRLSTDGTIQPRVTPPQSGFGWVVTLSQTAPAPTTQDISLTVDTLESTRRLLLGIYDTAPPIRFYDPSVGDQLLVIPGYEVGRAMATARNFPQINLLSTLQGVAVVSSIPDLKVTQTRAGTILSAEGGLALSEHLPTLTNQTPVAATQATLGVMMPYEQWYVAPADFRNAQAERLQNVAVADKTTKPEALMDLVKLYLTFGMGHEAHGVLELLRTEYPQYYTTNKLALLSGVSNLLARHYEAATAFLMAPELNELEEATLWRQVAGLYAPPKPVGAIPTPPDAATPATDSAENSAHAAPTTADESAIKASRTTFQFMKYSRNYIRFYPPRIRYMLATTAADAYYADEQLEKALAVYDTLARDGILTPLRWEAEFMAAAVNAKTAGSNIKKALGLYDHVAQQTEDKRSAVRARYTAALLQYHKGEIDAAEAADAVEKARLNWRGDAIERDMLKHLINLYADAKRYDDALRTYRNFTDIFATDPDILTITNDMNALFRRIFLEDLGDEMEPLTALALFYEFRELTPLGDEGDLMIQKLADRLAALDLLERASGLLEHQIAHRLKGEARARVGARLALLHLLNKNPEEALRVLETTNFGSTSPELQTTRLQLMAKVLTTLNKNEEALSVLINDTTPTGALLRLDILWAMKDWPSMINRAEDILNTRTTLTDPLDMKETEVLLKLALAYTFEGDYNQLRYLRDFYSPLIPDTAYKPIFEYLTNDTTPLDTEDFDLITRQISRTEGFLETFKSKIAEGKLSEAVQ